MALNLKNEAFIVNVTFISLDSDVHLFQGALIAFQKADGALIFILAKILTL